MRERIPKDFLEKEEELRDIISEVEELNKRLEQIYIYRSHKSKRTGEIHTIHKKHLKLEFITIISGGLIRHPPPPREIRL